MVNSLNDPFTDVQRPPEVGSAARHQPASDWYPLLLLSAVVFIIVFPWHATNQRLPIWDSAEFVQTAQKIADRFGEGTLEGVRALYLERGWRPIVFPSVAAPFFVLTSGDILLSVGLVQLFSVWLIAVYLYLLLRQELPPGRALIGALVIVSAEWVVNFSNVFYAELFALGATAGAMYHLSLGLRGHSRHHFLIAGMWVGLVGAARPIETAVIGAIPALVLLGYGWRSNMITPRSLVLFFCQVAAVIGGALLLTGANPNGYVALGLGLVALYIVGHHRRLFFTERPMLGFLIAAELVAFGWHYPAMRGLYLWVYETSFGSLALISDQRFSGMSPIAVFNELVARYSPIVLAALFVCAFACVIALARRRRTAAAHVWMVMAGVAVVMIGPMLVLHSVTGTSDTRRIMPGMLLLYLAFTGLALVPGGILGALRLAVVFGIVALQVAMATANGLNLRLDNLQAAQRYSGYLRQPSESRDPNEPVLEGLTALGIAAGSVSAYSYCYRDYDQCERMGYAPFEPVALSTLAQQRDLPISVHFMGDLDFTKPDTLAAQIEQRHYRYVLVDMFDSPTEAVNRADPYVVHTERFISLLNEKELPPGLDTVGCFTASNRPMCVIRVEPRSASS